MKRFVVAIAWLISAAACTGGTDLTAANDRAQEVFRAGDTAAALALIDAAVARPSDAGDSEAMWRLRLMRSEILIARRQFDPARELLQKIIPDRINLGPLRAKQRYLEAKLAFARNDLARTVAAVAEARVMFTTIP